MTTNQIILILDEEQAKLYEALQNAKLVFGADSEAAKLARARWVTAVDMLNIVKSKNQ